MDTKKRKLEEEKHVEDAASLSLNFLRIDLHTHILPEDIPDLKEKFGYGEYIKLDHFKKGKAKMMLGEKFFREIESNCWDCGTRVEECDSHGVHVQVLSTVPVMFNYQCQPKDTLYLARFLNEHIANCVKARPDRFLGLGTVPMQDPVLAAAELKRCVEELGLSGVQIGSRINGWNLDQRDLDPFWEEAERLQACIFVHPWDMDSTRAPKYWIPWLVGMPAETATAVVSMISGGVLARYPRLKVAFAHGGGQFPFTLGRIEKGFKCRPDLCAVDNKINPREYIGKFWVDSLVHDKKALRYLIDVIGSDKICLGSDYPFPLGEDVPGTLALDALKEKEITRDQVKDIYHNAALSFLGIDRETAAKRFNVPLD